MSALVTGKEAAPAGHTLRNGRIALVVFVIVAVVVAHRFGLLAQLSEPALLKEKLIELGPWGYVAFVVAYAAFQPWGIPGSVFVVAASLVWPWPVAFSLSMIGTMSSTVVAFSFSRFVARDAVAKRVPARLTKYEDALERRAFATVVLLRLVFWMSPLLHAFFGVSKVRFWTHFWGSFVGYVPVVLLISLFGERVFVALRAAPPSVWLGLGATAVVAIAFVVWRRRVSSSRTHREP